MQILLEDVHLNFDSSFLRTHNQFFSPSKIVLKHNIKGATIDEDLSAGLGARPTLNEIKIRDNLTCALQAPSFQKNKNYSKLDQYYLTRVDVNGISGWNYQEDDQLWITFKFSNDFLKRSRPNALWVQCKMTGTYSHYFGYRDLLKKFKTLSLNEFNQYFNFISKSF
jgi:hypothetical protein